MKKSLLILVSILINCLGAMAQESLVATLSHNGDIKSFFGHDALIKAYEEAEDGDVITLSSGYFDSDIEMSKSLTIRGAGWEDNPEQNRKPTKIKGDLAISLGGVTCTR